MSTSIAVRFTRQDNLSVENAIRYVEENYAQKLTAPDLAQRFLIPTKKLHAGVKKKTGRSFHKFLAEVRLGHAIDLLTNDVPIKKIPSMIGYSSVSHFIQLFKKETGMTPAEYRAIKPDEVK